MKKILLALGLSTVFFAGACDDGSDKLKSIKDKMCECKDVACVTSVTGELTKAQGDIKETDGNKKLVTEIMACAQKAVTQ